MEATRSYKTVHCTKTHGVGNIVHAVWCGDWGNENSRELRVKECRKYTKPPQAVLLLLLAWDGG